MAKSLSLDQFIPYRFNRLAQQVSTSLSKIYSDQFGLSIAQWRILSLLAENKKLQAKQITKLTTMDKVKVSRAITALLDEGLIVKSPCPLDSRSSDIGLSPAGRRRFQKISPLALRWEEEFLSPLDKGEREIFLTILGKLENQVILQAPDIK